MFSTSLSVLVCVSLDSRLQFSGSPIKYELNNFISLLFAVVLMFDFVYFFISLLLLLNTPFFLDLMEGILTVFS